MKRTLPDLISSNLIWSANTYAASNSHNVSQQDITTVFTELFSHEVRYSYHDALNPSPPVAIFLPFLKSELARHENRKRFVVFVGRSSWPTPHYLQQCFAEDTFERFLFINPSDTQEKLHAIQTTLSSKTTFALIVEVERLSFSFTQKILILSKQNKIRTYLFRNKKVLPSRTAAQAVWDITPLQSETDNPCWRLTLTHIKGKAFSQNTWDIESRYEKEVSINFLPQLEYRHYTEKVAV